MKKQYIRPAMQIYQLGLDESILMNSITSCTEPSHNSSGSTKAY